MEAIQKIQPWSIPMINKEEEIQDKNLIKIILRRSPNITESKIYKLKMGNFESGSPESILKLLTKFDKAVIGTGTSSPVGNIAFLRTFLHGKALRKYELIISTYGSTT